MKDSEHNANQDMQRRDPDAWQRPAPLRVPKDYRGPLTLPSGRVVWWTGRVAIGIRHDAPRNDWPSRCALWLQSLLTTKGAP